MPSTIAERLQATLLSITHAAERAQRPADDIQLLAVSKTKPVSDIMLAYAAGQRHFGENYVQEGVNKVAELAHLSDLVWHFIGPLQSNKSALVAKNFSWCHTVERNKIAQRLNDQRPTDLPPLNVCIQININEEASKSGILPAELPELAEFVDSLPHLTLRGLMAIPKADQSEAELQQTFLHLNTLFTQLQSRYASVDTLSMGMSGDCELAIACGSTMVRVGTGIFGARQ
jgi:pyridoxal phosphate enzyme (YggS family)